MSSTAWRGCLLAGILLISGWILQGITWAAETASSATPTVVYTKGNAPATPRLEDLPFKQSVTQNGITWKFEKAARVGQFLTGDWYVVGPATVKETDPKPLFGDEVKTAPVDQHDTRESHYAGQYARNGSTLNMPAVVPPDKLSRRTGRSGFDSRMPADTYDPGQFTKLPISMKPGDSLASSISAEPFDDHPIKGVAILTCVAGPQPPDAFRPSFCQTATCKPFLARNLRRDLLLNLPKPGSAGKVMPADYAECFDSPWIDTVGFGRAMPRLKINFYGSTISEMVGGCSLLLLLDYTPAEKEPLLLNLVQRGIDEDGLVRGGGGWPAEGGSDAGRKWLILFAGLMLDDPTMYDLTKNHPDTRFHEDEQTWFCPLEFVGKKYEHGWTGAKVVWTGHYAYYRGQWRTNKWEGQYDPVDLIPPSEWIAPWPVGSEGYRRNTTSASWVAQALAAHLMHAEKLWNHDDYFAYVDRWMTEDDAPFREAISKSIEARTASATTDAQKKELETARTQFEHSLVSGTISGRPEMAPIVKELWVAYRDNLPPASDGAKIPPAATTWK